MKQQLHFVTVAATDLDATRRFYGALGWAPLLDVEGEIIFYQSAPGQLLGFFLADKFNEDLAAPGDHSQVSGITLAHNVDSPEDVTALAGTMSAAGGAVLKPPSRASSAGCSTPTFRTPTDSSGKSPTTPVGGSPPTAPSTSATDTPRARTGRPD